MDELLLLSTFIGGIFNFIGWLIIVIHLANISENTKLAYKELLKINQKNINK